MAKLCNAAPAFFIRNPEGRDGISPRPSLLVTYRAYSAAAQCLVPADIRHRRGGVKQVLINPNHCTVLTYLKKGGNYD